MLSSLAALHHQEKNPSRKSSQDTVVNRTELNMLYARCALRNENHQGACSKVKGHRANAREDTKKGSKETELTQRQRRRALESVSSNRNCPTYLVVPALKPIVPLTSHILLLLRCIRRGRHI